MSLVVIINSLSGVSINSAQLSRVEFKTGICWASVHHSLSASGDTRYSRKAPAVSFTWEPDQTAVFHEYALAIECSSPSFHAG